MTDWCVGDLAVCVDAKPQAGDWLSTCPLIEGRIYTVTGIYALSRPTNDRCRLGFTLAEVSPSHGRLGFCADRFRRIVKDAHEASEKCEQLLTLLKRRKVSA